MKQQNKKHEKCHYVRCTRCTYNEYIKMRPTDDGFLKAICPRCEAEYLGLIKKK